MTLRKGYCYLETAVMLITDPLPCVTHIKCSKQSIVFLYVDCANTQKKWDDWNDGSPTVILPLGNNNYMPYLPVKLHFSSCSVVRLTELALAFQIMLINALFL